MKKLIVTLCVLLGALSLEGCAGNGYSPYYGGGFARHQRALAGTAMGAAGGALLGGAVTQDSDGALIGGLLGGATGGLIGHSMDRAQQPQPYYGGDGYPQNYASGYGHRHHRHHGHGYDDD